MLLAIPLVFVVSLLIFLPIMGRIAQTPEAMEALSHDPEAMNQALIQALGPAGMIALEIGGLVIYCLALGLIAFLFWALRRLPGRSGPASGTAAPPVPAYGGGSASLEEEIMRLNRIP